MAKGKAVFLDRDGTLNEDPGYLNNPQALKLFSPVPTALQRLTQAGFKNIVISNQSGLNRGLIKTDELAAIHARMNQYLMAWKTGIDAFKICPHLPSEKCHCRKPETQLIERAVAEFELDLQHCFLIGDRESDLQAGRRAQVGKVILVLTGNGSETAKKIQSTDCDFIAQDLGQAADWILAQSAGAAKTVSF